MCFASMCCHGCNRGQRVNSGAQALARSTGAQALAMQKLTRTSDNNARASYGCSLKNMMLCTGIADCAKVQRRRPRCDLWVRAASIGYRCSSIPGDITRLRTYLLSYHDNPIACILCLVAARSSRKSAFKFTQPERARFVQAILQLRSAVNLGH